jgi:hypothetical protein
MPGVRVRRAVAGDEGEILRMIVALATFEREPDAVKATEESLRALMFGDNPKVFAHIDRPGAVVPQLFDLDGAARPLSGRSVRRRRCAATRRGAGAVRDTGTGGGAVRLCADRLGGARLEQVGNGLLRESRRASGGGVAALAAGRRGADRTRRRQIPNMTKPEPLVGGPGFHTRWRRIS